MLRRRSESGLVGNWQPTKVNPPLLPKMVPCGLLGRRYLWIYFTEYLPRNVIGCQGKMNAISLPCLYSGFEHTEKMDRNSWAQAPDLILCKIIKSPPNFQLFSWPIYLWATSRKTWVWKGLFLEHLYLFQPEVYLCNTGTNYLGRNLYLFWCIWGTPWVLSFSLSLTFSYNEQWYCSACLTH